MDLVHRLSLSKPEADYLFLSISKIFFEISLQPTVIIIKIILADKKVSPENVDFWRYFCYLLELKFKDTFKSDNSLL